MRYLLKLAYDGEPYAGWQRQKNAPSIAATLEDALSRLCNQPICLTGAGRTDRGVHAVAQYAHWDLYKPLPMPFLPRLAALLPPSIQPLALYQVPTDFHARHTAQSRTYRYLIGHNLPLFWRKQAYHAAYLPALSHLQEAAQLWLGSHDFRAFCKGASAYPHTQCLVHSAHWHRHTYPWGTTLLLFEIEADRFLHGMVRFLVGAAWRYATHRLSREILLKALHQGDRQWGLWQAPAHGLYLYAVRYPTEALYLLEHYGPSTAEPLPAPSPPPSAEPSANPGSPSDRTARRGLGPAH
jgi:tRNA pseudouridine38-40 synthase